MPQDYDLLAFSRSNLCNALSNKRCAPQDVQNHSQVDYLCGYLSNLSARKILIENDYTDGDYLDDFAAFYVKCFKPYVRRCKRVHFFSRNLTNKEFLRWINADAPAGQARTFSNSYLGFVVARPLPDAIIGRTILKTYPTRGGRRHYPCTREYRVNLFGIPLTVNSLAFQEQDTVLAACATVALWSCFPMTAELFGTPAPRPADRRH